MVTVCLLELVLGHLLPSRLGQWSLQTAHCTIASSCLSLHTSSPSCLSASCLSASCIFTDMVDTVAIPVGQLPIAVVEEDVGGGGGIVPKVFFVPVQVSYKTWGVGVLCSPDIMGQLLGDTFPIVGR